MPNHEDEINRRKRGMRPDALVIPEDVWLLLKEPVEQKTLEDRRRVLEHISRATEDLFPGVTLEQVPLQLHQGAADSIIALAACYETIADERLRRIFRQLIENASVTARTNYQFIRHVIRRTLAEALTETSQPVPDRWNKCLLPVTDGSASSARSETKDGDADAGAFKKKFVLTVAEELARAPFSLAAWAGRMAEKGIIAAAGAVAGDVAGLPVVETLERFWVLISKGEFEHYDEIKDTLEVLCSSNSDDFPTEVRVLKGKKGWQYVRDDLNERGIECRAWDPGSLPIRFYSFANSYLLLFSLGQRQFLAFCGCSIDGIAAARELFEHNWDSMSMTTLAEQWDAECATSPT